MTKIVDVVRTTGSEPLPDSLYATEAGARERGRLDTDRTVDVAVVGAGILGLSTALALAEAGVDCAVIEANQPGWGASGRNGGQVNSGLKYGPNKVAETLGEEAVTFSYAAPRVVGDLVARLALDCEYVNGGGYRAAVTESGAKSIEGLAQELQRHGIAAEFRSSEAMRSAAMTDRYAAGLFDPAAGQLNPMKFTRALADAAQAAGAAIYCDSPVTSAKKANSWELATPTGTLRADKLFVATNGYTSGLIPRLRRSVIPVFSSILATAPLPEAVAGAILASGEVLYETGTVTVYYRVDAQKRLIFGGRGPQAHGSGPNFSRSLQAIARAIWPDLAPVGWTHGWNGRIALTADNYPHLHDLAGAGLACLGFNGRGVALSTALGPRIAQRLIEGRAAHLPFPVTPIKAIPFQPFWPMGVAARLAWHDLFT